MIIRPALSMDAAACRAIYAPFVTESCVSFEASPPSVGEMAERISSSSATHAWLVAEEGGHVCGYAYGSPHRTREAYGTSCDVAIYLDSGFTGRGIGRMLYGSLLPALAGRGYHAAFAGITLPNTGSVGLHEAMGFSLVGVYREVGWKLGAWRDVGWWQRLL